MRLRPIALAALVLWILGTPRLDARLSASALGQEGLSPSPLDEQATVERTIASGQRHRYAVTLTTGEFLFASVEQRGVDVSVRLLDPSGTVVTETDSPNGDTGPERITVIATLSGTHILEVIDSNPAAIPAGRYSLRVGAHRIAVDADRVHVEAERLFNEAQALLARRSAGNQEAAATRLERASALFSAQGFRYEAGLALFSEGSMRLQAGAPHAALAPLRAAQEQFERSDPMYAFVLNSLGGTYDLLGEPDAALTAYREVLDAAVAAGDTAREANLRNNIGVIYARVGDWPGALTQYRAALATFQRNGDRRREALALHNIGVSYQSARELERSHDFLEQSLTIRQAVGDAAGEASTLMQLGVNAALQGDHQTAVARYDEALTLLARTPNPVREAELRARLGYAHLLAGRPEMALTEETSAATLARSAGDRREEVTALIWKADAQLALHNSQSAHTDAAAALTLAEALNDRERIGMALVRRARAERESGDLNAALVTFTTALGTLESVRGTVTTVELRASYAGRYQDAYAETIDLLMRLHDQRHDAGFAAQALEIAERARARSLLDLLAESGADLRRGASASLLERQRALAHALDAKADRLVTLQRGPASAELEAVSREVSLLDAEYEEVRASLRRESPAYASLTQPEPLAPTAIQQNLLDAQTTLIEYALGETASYAWVVRRDGLTGVRLAPRREIDSAAREAYELLTARGQVISGETTTARRQRLADADVRLPAALRRVSDLVIAPLGDVGPGTRLAIVADGALQYLPFETLPIRRRLAQPATGGVDRPLITDFEIVMLPSASALSVQRQQLAGRARAPRGVAVFADPVFDALDHRFDARAKSNATAAIPTPDEARLLVHSDGSATATPRIPRLPFTRDEANAILMAATGQRNFSALGFAADKSAATSAHISEYRYVHFATHGVLDAERPSLSALVLSLVGRDGQPREGFLRAHEMYNLDLHADLVVLSACQTGLGKEISGEGIVGLTRGLMYAGASRVIVSLWSVSDRGTADLMARLYRSMLKDGRTPAAALRTAQLALMTDPRWKHPYYWAPFVLQGEWN